MSRSSRGRGFVRTAEEDNEQSEIDQLVQRVAETRVAELKMLVKLYSVPRTRVRLEAAKEAGLGSQGYRHGPHRSRHQVDKPPNGQTTTTVESTTTALVTHFGPSTPEDAYMLKHLLFDDAEGRKYAAACVLRKNWSERALAHNLAEADKAGATFMPTHGDKVLALAYPLWATERKELQGLSITLLNSTNIPSGGSAGATFSSVASGGFARGSVTTRGGYAAVGQLQDGSFAADVTALENMNKRLKDQIVRASGSRGCAQGGGPLLASRRRFRATTAGQAACSTR
jgi:hypothetical protein